MQPFYTPTNPAAAGGAGGPGAVYKLTPAGDGTWNESVIYSFEGSPDGASAWGVPVFDSSGNLYGTTNGGGAKNPGTIYELTPSAGGGWTEQVLHSFHGASDGSAIFEGLTLDAAGNLYGAAETGGSGGCGVAFELSRTPRVAGPKLFPTPSSASTPRTAKTPTLRSSTPSATSTEPQWAAEPTTPVPSSS